MTDPAIPTPERPRLALRVGITGARRLKQAHLTQLETQVESLLKEIQKTVAVLADEAAQLGEHYRSDQQPLLRMVSPLARGADRLAARAAQAAGYELYVPMPFAQAEYELDFTGTDGRHPDEPALTADEELAAFRELLSQAACSVELDGSRRLNAQDTGDSLAPAAYEAVGRFVVRHCDLLVAIWDGKPSNGRGGTAEIVQYAAEAGVPVWWIDANAPANLRWIADELDLPPRAPAKDTSDPKLRLAEYLRVTILPPAKPREEPHGFVNKIAQWIKLSPPTALDLFFSPPQESCVWLGRVCPKPLLHVFLKTHKLVMDVAERGFHWQNGEMREEPKNAQPDLSYWSDLFEKAESLALNRTKYYRCGYVTTILLAMLAPILGVLAVVFTLSSGEPTKLQECLALTFTALELIDLFLILLIVVVSTGLKWHQRAVEFRLLAELCRQQTTLANLGWALPIGHVQQVGDAEQQGWIGWYFAAAQRSAPVATGARRGQAQRQEAQKAVAFLVEDQRVYHLNRAKRMGLSSHFFELWGGRLFLAVLLLVLIKVGLEIQVMLSHEPHHHGINWGLILLGMVAIVLPTVSAAFVALRSYAELQMLHEQSEFMQKPLKQIDERLKRIQIEHPLAPQDLGAEALNLAAVMLNDLEGWGRLFRGKFLETA